MKMPLETSVLIVGGGPTGLATAVELGRYDIDCVVLEPRMTVSPLRPRAKTSNVRTLEHFRRWGLADRLRTVANLPVAWSQDVSYCTSLLGSELTRFNDCFGLSTQRRPEFAESGQQVAQPIVEQLLREAVGELPAVTLALGLRLESCTELADGSAVLADTSGPDGQRQRITARYVVGCDGQKSRTRESIGAKFVGSDAGRENVNLVFRAPGLAQKLPHRPAVHYWVVNSRVLGVVGPLRLEEDLWWATVTGVDSEADELSPARLLQDLIGQPIDGEILSTDLWRAGMRLSDTFQKGRIFLAGDAAHLNPPWGGHGFNTGIGDAANIGWKLAAVLRGWGGPGLLASYNEERRKVAEQTIQRATADMKASGTLVGAPALDWTGPEGDAARAALATEIYRTRRSEFHSLGLILGYEYDTSPVIVGEGEVGVSRDPRDQDLTVYHPSPRPGARLPHSWLPDGRSLYDVLGKGLTLLRYAGSDHTAELVTAAERRGIPLDVRDLSNVVPAPDGACALLVRPDQHIAWRGTDSALSADEAGTVLDLVLGMTDASRPASNAHA